MLAVVIQMSSYLLYCQGESMKILNGLKFSSVFVIQSGWSYSHVRLSQLTHTLSYSCHIHCHLLSSMFSLAPNNCRVTEGSLQLMYNLLWYSTIFMQDDILSIFDNCMTMSKFLPVLFEFERDHLKSPINGSDVVVKHSFLTQLLRILRMNFINNTFQNW